MAKYCALLVVALLTATGCQSQQPVQLVDRLPSPNFGGPVLPERVAPAPQPPPPPVVAQVPAPQPHPMKNIGAVPAAWVPVTQANQWHWIVIHHSATPTGGAAAFDKMHRAKGWDELGYHFVIGNGTDTRDGQIEVGSRWPKQKWGAHDKTPGNQYNEHGIGICLVGNFDAGRPSPAQIQALEKLVSYLMRTYHIPANRVLGHGETKATDCPGRFLNVAMVRRACAEMVAHSGQTLAVDTRTAALNPDRELLTEER